MMFLNRERINKGMFVGGENVDFSRRDCIQPLSVYDSRGKGSLEEENAIQKKIEWILISSLDLLLRLRL